MGGYRHQSIIAQQGIFSQHAIDWATKRNGALRLIDAARLPALPKATQHSIADIPTGNSSTYRSHLPGWIGLIRVLSTFGSEALSLAAQDSLLMPLSKLLRCTGRLRSGPT